MPKARQPTPSYRRGKPLQTAIKSAGISERKLAKMAGVSRQTLRAHQAADGKDPTSTTAKIYHAIDDYLSRATVETPESTRDYSLSTRLNMVCEQALRNGKLDDQLDLQAWQAELNAAAQDTKEILEGRKSIVSVVRKIARRPHANVRNFVSSKAFVSLLETVEKQIETYEGYAKPESTCRLDHEIGKLLVLQGTLVRTKVNTAGKKSAAYRVDALKLFDSASTVFERIRVAHLSSSHPFWTAIPARLKLEEIAIEREITKGQQASSHEFERIATVIDRILGDAQSIQDESLRMNILGNLNFQQAKALYCACRRLQPGAKRFQSLEEQFRVKLREAEATKMEERDYEGLLWVDALDCFMDVLCVRRQEGQVPRSRATVKVQEFFDRFRHGETRNGTPYQTGRSLLIGHWLRREAERLN